MSKYDPTDHDERLSFEWRWRDPSHLEAHRDEFLRPLDEILEELRPHAAQRRPAPGGITQHDELELHGDFELESTVGESGLREVPPDGSESFWAYRPGRSIPSHLCLGKREPTRHVCLWGRWEPAAFVIHTLYPGRAAPREIHDPEVPLEELPAAIEFWRNHAIITKEGAYSRTPH